MPQILLELLDISALGQCDLGQLYRAIERMVGQDKDSIARAQALIDASRALLRKTENLVEPSWW